MTRWLSNEKKINLIGYNVCTNNTFGKCCVLEYTFCNFVKTSQTFFFVNSALK